MEHGFVNFDSDEGLISYYGKIKILSFFIWFCKMFFVFYGQCFIAFSASAKGMKHCWSDWLGDPFELRELGDHWDFELLIYWNRNMSCSISIKRLRFWLTGGDNGNWSTKNGLNGLRGFNANYKLCKDGNETYVTQDHLWRQEASSLLFQVATQKVLLDYCVIVTID
jgi:hypothetical protein